MKKSLKIKLTIIFFKIDSSIKNFRFNVSIAQFYEIYNFIRTYLEADISNVVLKKNLIYIMKLMIPFTPHLAHECLELMRCKNKKDWPKIDEKKLVLDIKIAVQINGKTRDILSIKKDLNQNEIYQNILKNSNARKYIENKKIKKTIFVKNKIVNYII